MTDPADKALKLAGAYKDAFATPAGQIVLDDLVDEAGVLSALMAGPEAGVWEHGRRSLGLYILEKLGWSASELAAYHRRLTHQTIEEATGDA